MAAARGRQAASGSADPFTRTGAAFGVAAVVTSDRIPLRLDQPQVGRGQGSGLFDSAVLGRARAAALELATSGPVGLVHGDLHPANVLSGPGAGMVAIDPRPAWGDPDFDTVDWVLEGVVERAELERRIEELSVLVPGLSPDRVLGWCRALAVLIAVPRICDRRHDLETDFLVSLARS